MLRLIYKACAIAYSVRCMCMHDIYKTCERLASKLSRLVFLRNSASLWRQHIEPGVYLYKFTSSPSKVYILFK